MIVVDASAVIELLLATPAGIELRPRLLDSGETLHAPEPIDLEVGQVLRRYERARLLSEARADEALGDFTDLPIERYSHQLLLQRAWELRMNLTLHDAVYVALAELLDVPLLTGDATLARVRHRARVELVSGK